MTKHTFADNDWREVRIAPTGDDELLFTSKGEKMTNPTDYTGDSERLREKTDVEEALRAEGRERVLELVRTTFNESNTDRRHYAGAGKNEDLRRTHSGGAQALQRVIASADAKWGEGK